MENYVLITGATGGLGRAFVKECAKNNWNMILTATNQKRLDKLKYDTEQKNGEISILTKACDLSDGESRGELVNFVVDNNLKVNRLILNAGYITQGRFDTYGEEEFLKAIRVNCEGNIGLFNEILKLKDENERLYVIVVSSFAAFNPMPYMAIYAATKTFLNSFFIAVREELRDRDVYITTVCPSGMATTQEMKNSIKIQGLGGKLTENSVQSIAKLSIKANMKNKPILVVRFMNKLLHFLGALLTQTSKAKMIAKRWKKVKDKLLKKN